VLQRQRAPAGQQVARRTQQRFLGRNRCAAALLQRPWLPGRGQLVQRAQRGDRCQKRRLPV
jgi:hypothetical protein